MPGVSMWIVFDVVSCPFLGSCPVARDPHTREGMLPGTSSLLAKSGAVMAISPRHADNVNERTE